MSIHSESYGLPRLSSSSSGSFVKEEGVIGGKAEGLRKLESVICSIGSTPLPIEIPYFIPISHGEIITFLQGDSPEDFRRFQMIVDSYRSIVEHVERNEIRRAEEVAESLKRLLKEALSSFTIERLNPSSLYMVRSSSSEDSEGNPNAGGNESIAHVRIEEIGNAIGETIASYFHPKSLLQRGLSEGRLSTELPPLSVLIQEMIGEDETSIPISGVLFTEYMMEGVALIQSSYGHGDGIVRSEVGIDSFFCDPSGFVYAKTAQKPTRFISTPEHGFRRIKNPEHLADTLSLTREMITTLQIVGKRAREIEGKELDIEFVIQNERVYLLQMRPLLSRSKEANFIPERGLSVVSKASVITAPAARVVRVSERDLVLQEKTLSIALRRLLEMPKEEQSQYKVVISEEMGGSTSHEATTLRMLGLSVIHLPAGVSAIPTRFFLDIQRGVIAEETDLLEDGYISYPESGPFEISLLCEAEVPPSDTEPLRFVDGRNLSEHINNAIESDDEAYGLLTVNQLGFLIERVRNYYPEKADLIPQLTALHTQLRKTISKQIHLGSRLLAKNSVRFLLTTLEEIEIHFTKFLPKTIEESEEDRIRYVLTETISSDLQDPSIEQVFKDLLASRSAEERAAFFEVAIQIQKAGYSKEWALEIVAPYVRESVDRPPFLSLISDSKIAENGSLFLIKMLPKGCSRADIEARFQELSFLIRIPLGSQIQKIGFARLIHNLIDRWDLYIKDLKGGEQCEDSDRIIKRLIEKGGLFCLDLISRFCPEMTVDDGIFLKSIYLDSFKECIQSLCSRDFSTSEYLPSAKFDVRAANCLSATEFRRHSPKTLEDLFTLIHQNTLSLSQFIRFDEKKPKQVLPTRFCRFLEGCALSKKAPLFTELGSMKLLSLENVNGAIRTEFQIPLRNHSATLLIEENGSRVNVTTVFLSDSGRPRMEFIPNGFKVLLSKYGMKGRTVSSPTGTSIECTIFSSKKLLQGRDAIIIPMLINFILFSGNEDFSWFSEEEFLGSFERRGISRMLLSSDHLPENMVPPNLQAYHAMCSDLIPRELLDLDHFFGTSLGEDGSIQYTGMLEATALSFILQEDEGRVTIKARVSAEAYPEVFRECLKDLFPEPNFEIHYTLSGEHEEAFLQIIDCVNRAKNSIGALNELVHLIKENEDGLLNPLLLLIHTRATAKEKTAPSNTINRLEVVLRELRGDRAAIRDLIQKNLFYIHALTPPSLEVAEEILRSIRDLRPLENVAMYSYFAQKISGDSQYKELLIENFPSGENIRVFIEQILSYPTELRKAPISLLKEIPFLRGLLFDRLNGAPDAFPILFKNIGFYSMEDIEWALESGANQSQIQQIFEAVSFRKEEWFSEKGRNLIHKYFPIFFSSVFPFYLQEFSEFITTPGESRILGYIEFALTQPSEKNRFFFENLSLSSSIECSHILRLIQEIAADHPKVDENTTFFLQEFFPRILSSLKWNYDNFESAINAIKELFDHQREVFNHVINKVTSPEEMQYLTRILITPRGSPVYPKNWMEVFPEDRVIELVNPFIEVFLSTIFTVDRQAMQRYLSICSDKQRLDIFRYVFRHSDSRSRKIFPFWEYRSSGEIQEILAIFSSSFEENDGSDYFYMIKTAFHSEHALDPEVIRSLEASHRWIRKILLKNGTLLREFFEEKKLDPRLSQLLLRILISPPEILIPLERIFRSELSSEEIDKVFIPYTTRVFQSPSGGITPIVSEEEVEGIAKRVFLSTEAIVCILSNYECFESIFSTLGIFSTVFYNSITPEPFEHLDESVIVKVYNIIRRSRGVATIEFLNLLGAIIQEYHSKRGNLRGLASIHELCFRALRLIPSGKRALLLDWISNNYRVLQLLWNDENSREFLRASFRDEAILRACIIPNKEMLDEKASWWFEDKDPAHLERALAQIGPLGEGLVRLSEPALAAIKAHQRTILLVDFMGLSGLKRAVFNALSEEERALFFPSIAPV